MSIDDRLSRKIRDLTAAGVSPRHASTMALRMQSTGCLLEDGRYLHTDLRILSKGEQLSMFGGGAKVGVKAHVRRTKSGAVPVKHHQRQRREKGGAFKADTVKPYKVTLAMQAGKAYTPDELAAENDWDPGEVARVLHTQWEANQVHQVGGNKFMVGGDHPGIHRRRIEKRDKAKQAAQAKDDAAVKERRSRVSGLFDGPRKDWPDMSRTYAAMDAFDAADASSPTSQADLDRVDALRKKVGEAFATDTADRNEHDVAARISQSAAGMRKLREWRKRDAAREKGKPDEGGDSRMPLIGDERPSRREARKRDRERAQARLDRREADRPAREALSKRMAAEAESLNNRRTIDPGSLRTLRDLAHAGSTPGHEKLATAVYEAANRMGYHWAGLQYESVEDPKQGVIDASRKMRDAGEASSALAKANNTIKRTDMTGIGPQETMIRIQKGVSGVKPGDYVVELSTKEANREYRLADGSKEDKLAHVVKMNGGQTWWRHYADTEGVHVAHRTRQPFIHPNYVMEKATRLALHVPTLRQSGHLPLQKGWLGDVVEWVVDNATCRFRKAETGVGVLTISGLAAMPYHVVCRTAAEARSQAVEVVDALKQGKTPKRGVYRLDVA